MSHPRAICRGSAIIQAMSRLALVVLLLSACTKAPANQEGTGKPIGEGPTTGAPSGEKIQVPGGDVKTVGAPEGTKGGDDARFKLQPEEGKLAIEAPADAKANAETTAKVIVTAGKEFKVNVEFPTKLTLENAQGVTIAKAELKAGGHDKSKGDADVFDEQSLVFAVKLTPTAAGNHTINGTFKFAVCDKAGSTCLAKKERIAIQVAAK
jgi:hypothetical protein